MSLLYDGHDNSPEGHYDWVTGQMIQIEGAFVGLQRSEHEFADFERVVKATAEQIIDFVRVRYVPDGHNWPLPRQVV